MNRNLLLFAALASTLLTGRGGAAMSLASVSPAGKSTLLIDGVACDRVETWDGGDLRGSVVTMALAGGTATKSTGGARNAPLELHVPLPLSPQLAALVNDLCTARFARHKLLLVDYNSTGVATAAFELNNALLSAVTFPAFDATTTTTEPVKLVFDVEQSAAVAVPSLNSALPSAQKASTFRLAIDGVDASKTVRIEPITVRVQSGSTDIGQTRLSTSTPTGVEFTNLRVTFSASGAATWKTWWTDAVVNGNASEATKKNGSIELIDTSGAPLPIALTFTRLGILRVSRPPGTAGVATKLEAEVYFESISLSGPVETSAPDSSSTSTETTPEQPASTSSTETTSQEATAASAPADTTETSSGPLQVQAPSRAAMTGDVPLVTSTSPVTAARTAPLATNPDDVGTRDPAQFPRVDGLTRTYYSGTYQPTYTSDQATYIANEKMETLVLRVDAAAKAAGWTMTTMTESAPNTGKSVAEAWVKGGASASVSYFQANNATSTQYNVQVYVKLDAPN